LANPWRPGQALHPLPQGTSILQVYDEAHGDLLILGEPGAGKTTLLLELTEVLIERAKKDPSHPLPVVFSLSSWTRQRKPLDEWMVEELDKKYRISRRLAEAWVRQDQIMPLFDGLDEVAEDYRNDCVKKINAYQHDHSAVPIVVCSRSTEYFAVKERLYLQCAVVIQPLTKAQIDTSLEALGSAVSELRKVIQKDTVLRGLATAPLFLSILISCCREGKIAPRLLLGKKNERQKALLRLYIKQVLEQSSTNSWTKTEVLRWLHWLAQQMVKYNRIEFFLEEIQFDWHPDPEQARFKFILCSLVSVSLAVGFAAGFKLGLGWGMFMGATFGGLAVLYLGETANEIAPVEILTWSWFRGSIGLFFGLAGGALFEQFVKGRYIEGAFFGLDGGLVAWLILGLVGGLLAGFSTNALNKSDRLRPNQGVRRSLYNGIYGLVGGLIVGAVAGQVSGQGALYGGLALGLIFGLLYGWNVFLTHWFLRLLLWRVGVTPRKYEGFLGYATRCTLMRRVGGGYIFLHRVLLDYCASPEVLDIE
jgi:hypothetical protein